MKKFRILALIIMAVLMVACSSEDAPEPKFHSPAKFFMPADDDNSPTAELRRDFFHNTGSFLLFNDTIQKNYVGKDINGDDVYWYETLDLGYSVGMTMSSDKYTFTYIEDYEDQKKVVDFLGEYVLYHFNGRIKPFSYFICNKMTLNYVNGSVASPYASSGQRGLAIAGNYLLIRDRNDSQKKNFAERVLNAVMGTLANNFSEDFVEFYNFSGPYYGALLSSYGTDNKQTLNMLGFIGTGSLTIYAPSRDEDMSQYALATLQYSEEEFAAKYSAYPVMIEKFRYVKGVFSDLGFVYDK